MAASAILNFENWCRYIIFWPIPTKFGEIVATLTNNTSMIIEKRLYGYRNPKTSLTWEKREATCTKGGAVLPQSSNLNFLRCQFSGFAVETLPSEAQEYTSATAENNSTVNWNPRWRQIVDSGNYKKPFSVRMTMLSTSLTDAKFSEVGYI